MCHQWGFFSIFSMMSREPSSTLEPIVDKGVMAARVSVSLCVMFIWHKGFFPVNFPLTADHFSTLWLGPRCWRALRKSGRSSCWKVLCHFENSTWQSLFLLLCPPSDGLCPIMTLSLSTSRHNKSPRRHNREPGRIYTAAVDKESSGQTSTLYSPSVRTCGATALPKDPPLYISMEQLIS